MAQTPRAIPLHHTGRLASLRPGGQAKSLRVTSRAPAPRDFLIQLITPSLEVTEGAAVRSVKKDYLLTGGSPRVTMRY